MSKLQPGCGEPPGPRTMWMSDNPCLIETCNKEECCYPAHPDVTAVKECSFVTLDADGYIVQLTPDNIADADIAEIFFAPKAMYPKDYCKDRMVWWHFCIECSCVNWCEDADEEFQALVWKMAGRRNKITCVDLNC